MSEREDLIAEMVAEAVEAMKDPANRVARPYAEFRAEAQRKARQSQICTSPNCACGTYCVKDGRDRAPPALTHPDAPSRQETTMSETETVSQGDLGRGAHRQSEMVEKVARALHALEWRGVKEPPAWGEDREYWLANARAAIEAMREPTQGQVIAAEREHGLLGGLQFEAGWRTMIDAALTVEHIEQARRTE